MQNALLKGGDRTGWVIVDISNSAVQKEHARRAPCLVLQGQDNGLRSRFRPFQGSAGMHATATGGHLAPPARLTIGLCLCPLWAWRLVSTP